ncbi:hypothetical protein DESUT3_21630 [Desulfuromonas versatilis]|uniref:Uncharacterized protein n=1 Tax=Desulfuromonas versatilis TaxID=2802975 RepID=A0ABM8HT10_9BACT|nr:hypothetical protein [Desulfuromonas versatilis]BCR05094.1 hypothetical protein DESUT3_21630 [Desulfuromonas versatilis]
MLIKVLFKNGKQERVTPKYLDHLINLQQVARFERTEGWITPGLDPTRAMKSKPYRGRERRTTW